MLLGIATLLVGGWRFVHKHWRGLIVAGVWWLLAHALGQGWLYGWHSPRPYTHAARILTGVVVVVVVLLFARWCEKRRAEQRRYGRPVDSIRRLLAGYLLFQYRRVVLRFQWQPTMEALTLTGRGALVPRAHHAKSRLNDSMTVYVSPGAVHGDTDQWVAKAPMMADHLTSKTWRFEPDDVTCRRTKPGKVEVTIHFSNPLRRIHQMREMPRIRSARHLCAGLDRDSRPLLFPKHMHMMLGGSSRSGKSTFMHWMIAQMLADGEWVELWISDAKGGLEMAEYSDKVGEWQGQLRVRGYAKTGPQTIKMLEEAYKAMDVRAGWLSKQRNPDGSRRRKLDRSSQNNPHVFVIIDEALIIPDALKGTKAPHLKAILAGGAALLYTVVLGTQDGRVESIPADIRTLLLTRIGFRLSDRENVACVLGPEALKKGALCTEIKDDEEGTFYIAVNGTTNYSKGRAPIVEDADVHLIAQGIEPKQMKERLTPPNPHKRYTAFDEHGVIVYEGETNSWERRLKEHQADDWGWCPVHGREENWWRVHVKTWKVTDCDTQAEAKHLEKQAIKKNRPLFNKTHNPNRWMLTRGVRLSGDGLLGHLPGVKQRVAARTAASVATPGDPEEQAEQILDQAAYRWQLEHDGTDWHVYDPEHPGHPLQDTGVWSE